MGGVHRLLPATILVGTSALVFIMWLMQTVTTMWCCAYLGVSAFAVKPADFTVCFHYNKYQKLQTHRRKSTKIYYT